MGNAGLRIPNCSAKAEAIGREIKVLKLLIERKPLIEEDFSESACAYKQVTTI